MIRVIFPASGVCFHCDAGFGSGGGSGGGVVIGLVLLLFDEGRDGSSFCGPHGAEASKGGSCGSRVAGSKTNGHRSCVSTLLASQIGEHAG
jgi:hypothetical protein